MTHRTIATLVGLLAVTGCGPVDEPSPSASPAGSYCVDEVAAPTEAVDIQVGYLANGQFELLEDGTVLYQEYGFQGGSHIDLAARVYGVEGEIEFTVDDGMGFSVTSIGDVPPCDGWAEAEARVFDPPVGTDMTFTLQLSGGQELTETLSIDIQ